MTQPPYQEPLPSRVPPILVGSLGSFGAVVLLSYLGYVNDVVGVFGLCCCLPVGFVPFGILPAYIARRREPTITPGGGFCVSFVAVGLGLVAWAAVASSNVDPGEVVEFVREGMEQGNREQGGELTSEEIDAMSESIAEMTPYVPAIYALVTTVLAGFVGLATVLMMRPRRGIGDYEPPA